jgi:hypothetical protein
VQAAFGVQEAMKKRVVDLTAEELDKLAADAWGNAAREALASGLPVTGSRDGRRIRIYPDGRTEDLGLVAELPEGAPGEKSRQSVA